MQELAFYCEVLTRNGITTTDVMFGYDSNLAMDEMWREMPVPPQGVVEFVLAAERAGTVMVGKSDIFVAASGIEIALCHESDLHIKAARETALEFFNRWNDKAYSPYALKPPAESGLGR